MYYKSQFHTLKYDFIMVSPTLQEISVNKQAIFEGRKQIFLFLCWRRMVF